MCLFSGRVHAEPSEIVLQTIAMESANQSAYGQYLVSSVIVSRSRASNRSLEAIVKAHKQFSCWNDTVWARAWLARHYTPEVRKQAIKALELAIREPINLSHYHTKPVKPYWSVGHSPAVIEGQHKFYRGIK